MLLIWLTISADTAASSDDQYTTLVAGRRFAGKRDLKSALVEKADCSRGETERDRCSFCKRDVRRDASDNYAGMA